MSNRTIIINTQYDLLEKYIELLLTIDTCCSQGGDGVLFMADTTFLLVNER